MSTTTHKKTIALAAGAALTASLALTPSMASADTSPFSSAQLSSGYMQLANHDSAEAKCGEAKCGAKAAVGTDADIDKKTSEYHDKMKAHEAKCGEAKCGAADKAKEAKCGEGKCGH